VRVALVGRPNVGKTLLLINFAAYWGVRELATDGGTGEMISIERARRECVSYVAHKYVRPLSVALWPSKSSDRSMILTDTPGILEGVPSAAKVRQAMAQGLKTLFEVEMILMVLDGSTSAISTLEEELIRLTTRIAPVMILDNKNDIRSEIDPRLHRRQFAGYPVLAVSAMTRRGFRDLKQRLLCSFEAES
jgi:small GTP-binding protein